LAENNSTGKIRINGFSLKLKYHINGNSEDFIVRTDNLSKEDYFPVT
jgi:hypothetical protein